MGEVSFDILNGRIHRSLGKYLFIYKDSIYTKEFEHIHRLSYTLEILLHFKF